jgi:hypothetical protein
VSAATHRQIDGTLLPLVRARGSTNPFQDEWRRGIAYDRVLAPALVTAVGIGLLGLIGAAILGVQGADIGLHLSFGFFSAMVLLLAHSMMMFYLIGKGKAVKDAMAEGGLTGDQYRRIALARKPVFGIGTLAMAVTMTAAILGASVDTRVLPVIVHEVLAYLAIASNVVALKVEISALSQASRVVDEVNRLLES